MSSDAFSLFSICIAGRTSGVQMVSHPVAFDDPADSYSIESSEFRPRSVPGREVA